MINYLPFIRVCSKRKWRKNTERDYLVFEYSFSSSSFPRLFVELPTIAELQFFSVSLTSKNILQFCIIPIAFPDNFSKRRIINAISLCFFHTFTRSNSFFAYFSFSFAIASLFPSFNGFVTKFALVSLKTTNHDDATIFLQQSRKSTTENLNKRNLKSRNIVIFN